ncbi:hypothetical protein QBC45DRAFT_457436 [Copromyces sp. CBS 386.78]|nr:hypothetical protein QBC45DRAFT_457436 [Copromyces sp. CBS 386.78]
MHLLTLLTTLTTLGLATLTSAAAAAALDTTTISASTSCTDSGLSSTCSVSTSTTYITTAASDSDSNGPQSIEDYIKAKQAQIAAENSNNNNDNSTMSFNITSTRHVSGMTAYEVPMCCVNGCRVCSATICGAGPSGCNDWPFYSCCSTIILWDTANSDMLDAFTTEGQTVEFQYD